eukprot:6182250-Pleurochrysis_carterae.AAC.1
MSGARAFTRAASAHGGRRARRSALDDEAQLSATSPRDRIRQFKSLWSCWPARSSTMNCVLLKPHRLTNYTFRTHLASIPM